MTAIVGVLSRQGIAFAADSAATVTSDNGKKITYHANKIFTLSKYYPVGVAIYNNLDFMGIPWDAIIKSYRDKIAKRTKPSLEEYITDFWAYIKKSVLPMVEESQSGYFKDSITNLYNQFRSESLNKIGGHIDDTTEETYFLEMVTRMQTFTVNNPDVAPDYQDYTKKNFANNASDLILSTLASDLAIPKCPKDYISHFEEAAYTLIRYNLFGFFHTIYSGLVFFGYGDKEILPSCISYKVNIAMANRIKYTQTDKVVIKPTDSAIILPFAQADVTMTVLKSIEDDLMKTFISKHKGMLTGFRDEITKQLCDSGAPKELLDVLNNINIDDHVDKYKNAMTGHIQKEYVSPMIDTVTYLSKEDLADLVESLVRMTCLKRRITKEDETVGGPVDVAVVTKGDGFIWMKRKHYFDPKLNQQFFERYNII